MRDPTSAYSAADAAADNAAVDARIGSLGVTEATKMSGFWVLDALLSMLSMGAVSLAQRGVAVTADAVATVFLLSWRCVRDEAVGAPAAAQPAGVAVNSPPGGVALAPAIALSNAPTMAPPMVRATAAAAALGARLHGRIADTNGAIDHTLEAARARELAREQEEDEGPALAADSTPVLHLSVEPNVTRADLREAVTLEAMALDAADSHEALTVQAEPREVATGDRTGIPLPEHAQTVLRLLPVPQAGPVKSRPDRANTYERDVLRPAVDVLPVVQAHWQALGEADAGMAAAVVRALDAFVGRRRRQVSAVLDEHSVPIRLRRAGNLIAGVHGVELPRACLSMDPCTKEARQQWSEAELASRLLALGCTADVESATRLVRALTQPSAVEAALTATTAMVLDSLDESDTHGALATSRPVADAALLPDAYITARYRSDRHRADLPGHLSTPTVHEVMQVLLWLGPHAREVDIIAGALADCVLHVYARWTGCMGGRLHSLCPDGASAADLFAARDVSFRLPFADMVEAVEQLAYSRRVVVMGAAEGAFVALTDPGGHRDRDATGMSAKQAKKMKTALNLWAPTVSSAVVQSPEVEEAYEAALSALNRRPRRLCSPLLRVHLRAVFVRLRHSCPRKLRLAAWLRLATALMARSYEGCSTLHADLEPPSWRVGRHTKTTDGLAGQVPLFSHRSGCRLGHVASTYELLAIPREQLVACACGELLSGGLDFDASCVVCLTALVRLDAGAASVEHHGLSPVLQAIDVKAAVGGAFDGSGVRLGSPNKPALLLC